MRNKLSKITYILFICILFITFLPEDINAEDNNSAINGVLDLTDYDWENNGMIPIEGEWEFYWNELYTPSDFENQKSIEDKNFMILPRAWNKY